jgi:asparagine synthase (glutamine-hydrolysing)
MCGIAGIVGYGPGAQTDAREVGALRDAQAHRGPDDAGLWLAADGRVGLGHRRLTIIDLSPLGHQPMSSADGRQRIVYNGEIYNHRELRAELEALGHAFRSSSDTEVLLAGYRAWGTGVLDRLRGMFAFAIHDADSGETLLARDPLGIKPLYTLDDGSRLLFASEIQALRRVADAGDLDPQGLASYLMWGSIPPPHTLYSRVRALPAGCWQRVGAAGPGRPHAYYRLQDELGRAEPMDAPTAAAALREALVDTARAHLVADVPVGAFLSGGVDSSALLGLLSEVQEAPIQSVTLSFDVPELDEGPLARLAAARYGSTHHEIAMRIDEARERLPDAIRALDQPSIDGVNTYFVSEAAARAGLKVAVSGVGGDEIFGGYASFARVPRLVDWQRRLRRLPGAGPLLGAAARGLGAIPGRAPSKLALALAFGGDEPGAYFADRGIFAPRAVRSLLAPEIAEAVDCDPVAELARRVPTRGLPEEERVSLLELAQYLRVQLLRDTDAVSMRHALEVRTPLVDRDLLRAAARIPPLLRRAGPAKRMLREAVQPPVPEALWNRPKQGFTLPLDSWMRSGAIGLDPPDHPWLRRKAVQGVFDAFRRGRLHHSRAWAFVVLREFLAL